MDTDMETQESNGNAAVDSSQQSPCCGEVRHSLSEQELAADIQTLSAVGNETRYEALRFISESENGICVCDLEPALGVSQSAVSQALSRLYAAGLVSRRKDGRWRYYRTTARADRLLKVLDGTRGDND